MDNKSEKHSVSLMDMDTRYRQLSLQLFGEHTEKTSTGFQGPFVDMSRKRKSKVNMSRRQKKEKMSSDRCLICYSPISSSQTVDLLENEKSWQDFYSFLNILQEPMSSSLNGNRLTINFALHQLRLRNRRSDWCLCVNCNAACEKLVEVHRQMKALEQEVKEFQAKFLNAIKLSKAISEKEAPEKVVSSSNKAVDQLRTCLIGGTEKWDEIKDRWMDYVNLEEKIVRNDSDSEEPLQMDNLEIPEIKVKIENELVPENVNVEMNSGGGDDDSTFFDADNDNLIIPSCNYDEDVPMESVVMPLKRENIGDELDSNLDFWDDDNNPFLENDNNVISPYSNSGDNRFKKRKLIRNQNGQGGGFKIRWEEKGPDKMMYCGVEISKNVDGTFSCISCGNAMEPVKTKIKMSIHIKKEHLAMTDAHACDKCDAKFFYHCQLLKHIRGKHEGGLRCDTCGERFQYPSSLFSHKKVKHQGIKPHVCEQCGKGFATVRDLTTHVRVHTGERPFVCHVCTKSFTQKQNMRQHIKKHHPADPLEEPVVKEVIK